MHFLSEETEKWKMVAEKFAYISIAKKGKWTKAKKYKIILKQSDEEYLDNKLMWETRIRRKNWKQLGIKFRNLYTGS